MKSLTLTNCLEVLKRYETPPKSEHGKWRGLPVAPAKELMALVLMTGIGQAKGNVDYPLYIQAVSNYYCEILTWNNLEGYEYNPHMLRTEIHDYIQCTSGEDQ